MRVFVRVGAHDSNAGPILTVRGAPLYALRYLRLIVVQARRSCEYEEDIEDA